MPIDTILEKCYSISMKKKEIMSISKKLSKTANISLEQAQAIILKNFGYQSWSHYCNLHGELNETNENVKITIKENFQERSQDKI